MTISFVRSVLPVILFSSACLLAQAQQEKEGLNKEVEVVKAYKPSVSEVFKINDQPLIKQLEAETPVFDYRIKPQPAFTTFNPGPVQAARVVGEPKAQLEKGLLKLGFGNYVTPYGELFFNLKSNQKNTFGMHFRHLSSHGKIKLENGDKVKAPSSENLIELFTGHFFDEATLSTKIYFDRDAFRYYGYAGEEMSDTEKEALIPFWNQKQAFSRGGVNLNLEGTKDTEEALRYEAGLKFQLFGTKTGQTEHLVNFNWLFENDYDLFKGQLDAEAIFSGVDSVLRTSNNTYGKSRRIMLNVKLLALFEQETTSFGVGVNNYNDFERGDFMFSPTLKASWSAVPNWLTLYGSFDSFMQNNQYSTIADENPFVDPFHDIRNTRSKYILTGGFRGKFAQRWGYRLQADYSNIRDDHFYILRHFGEIVAGSLVYTSKPNTFDVVYDNVKTFSLGGEISYAYSDQLSALFKLNHYSYDLDNQAEPWHKPGFEAYTSVNFAPEGPFRFTADIFYVGKRKALVISEFSNSQSSTIIEQTYDLDAVMDMNFGIDYKYSSQLNFWGRVNNLSAQKYDTWLGYTNKKLNIILGMSYTF